VELRFADVARLQETLLKTERSCRSERMSLAESVGWTYKYAWDLTKGDEVILDEVEGEVDKVVTGPHGTQVWIVLDEHVTTAVFVEAELVRVGVSPAPEPF
jgi:hypothetical protein